MLVTSVAAAVRVTVWVLPCHLGEDPRAVGRWAARAAVADALAVPLAEVVLDRAPGGRPVVAGAHDGAAAVSITHTGGLVAVAVASGALLLGVDAERLRPVRAAVAIAGRRFHPAESAVLTGLAEPALSREFLRMWSLKEAHGKAVGHGVAMSLSTCRTIGSRVEAPPPPGGGAWFSGVQSPPSGVPGHVLAVVVGTPPGAAARVTVEVRHGTPGVDGWVADTLPLHPAPVPDMTVER